MDDYLSRWKFVRSETLELLDALTDEQLSFQPEGPAWQPLYYQFGCVARTQLIYAEAIKVRKMDFALFSSDKFPGKHDNKTRGSLAELLDQAETAWQQALAQLVGQQDGIVAWPDGDVSVAEHVARLAEHERLHHGQLISYFTLAGFELPKKFKNNWAL